MKALLIYTPLLVALTFTGCATVPSKPKTFDQLGQFTAYPLNNKTYRIGFQADNNLSYGTAEEITLLKAAQTTIKNGRSARTLASRFFFSPKECMIGK